MPANNIEYSFFPKEIEYDSNWLPIGLKIFFSIYIGLFLILYLDSIFFANGWLVIFYIIICLFSSMKYVYNLKKKAKETFGWERVKARVLDKNIYIHYSILRPYLYPYQLRIVYEYNLEGQTIKSDQFALGQYGDRHCNYFYDTVENTRKVASKLIQDTTLNIYVNPENIHESVVKQGYDPYREPSYLTVLFSFLLAFFIAYIYIFVQL
ncbi:hypothetical protein [Sulfurimonas sp.]|uniref:hypothetical protein n=1 Tax=Sulfurimonas sp. TaxID=2022749 RepID=UPI003D12A953